MEELQLTLTPSRVDQRNNGIMLSNWRVGQTLSALVVDRMPNGSSLLSIAGQSFISPSDIPVQPGNRVYLEVQKTAPHLIFKLRLEDPAPAPRVPSAVLGGTLAIESKLASGALAKLLSFVSSNAGLQKQISASGLLGQLFSQLKANSLHGSRIDASALHRHFILSGIFTEAQWLAQRGHEAAKSNKSLLLAINDHIHKISSRASPGSPSPANIRQLLSLIDSALSSITQNQIVSISDANAHPKWSLTVPFEWRNEYQEIDVEVRRGTDQGNEDEETWTVSLRIELPELGGLELEVGLKGGRVSVRFAADDAAITHFEPSLEYLTNQLIMAGLKVDSVSAKRVEFEKTRGFQAQKNGVSVFA